MLGTFLRNSSAVQNPGHFLSIYPLSILLILLGVIGQKAGCTVDKSPVCFRAELQRHTVTLTGNLESDWYPGLILICSLIHSTDYIGANTYFDSILLIRLKPLVTVQMLGATFVIEVLWHIHCFVHFPLCSIGNQSLESCTHTNTGGISMSSVCFP